MAEETQYEVLDENGHRTGQIMDRKTVHQKELWHGVANVWIVNSKGEILMQLRGPGMELAPNVWDVTIGTHLRVNENPMQAALRALDTELGLRMTPDDLKHLFNIQCANPMPDGTTHKVLGHVFLVHRDLDFAELRYDPQKITRFAWVPMDALVNEVGSEETKNKYFPRANNYYPQLFEAFHTWL